MFALYRKLILEFRMLLRILIILFQRNFQTLQSTSRNCNCSYCIQIHVYHDADGSIYLLLRSNITAMSLIIAQLPMNVKPVAESLYSSSLYFNFFNDGMPNIADDSVTSFPGSLPSNSLWFKTISFNHVLLQKKVTKKYQVIFYRY